MSKQTSQEQIEEIKQFLKDNGIRNSEPMVAGVVGREPTAEEFIDYWSPKLAKLINKLLIEAELDILIWATGGIAEFTEEGKEVIQNKIAELQANLNNSDKESE